MKILHVETGRHLYGGPQQVLYLMAGLTECGHESTLVCPPGSGIDSAARERAIHVQNLFCAGDLDLPFAYRLTQFISESKPDLVHCHSRRGADILGGLAASFADVPAVVSRRVDNTEMKLVAAIRYRPFKKVIAISEAIADVLRERGVEEERLVVIRSAVDSEAVSKPSDCNAMRAEFDVPEGMFVIAAAGQLIARKGHNFLLDAVAELRHTHAPFRLTIFGDGPLETELREQATTLGLGDTAQFAGYRDDLDSYIACFDLLVHPALAEGLGVIALKAAAAGVPVVGFAAGGLVEAVQQNKTGLLVPPGDTEALRAAIADLMDDDERRASFGAAGKQRMQAEFSIDTMVDQHIKLYEQVLND